MNRWIALIIGVFVSLFGLIIGGEMIGDRENSAVVLRTAFNWGLLFLYTTQILALIVFLIFLRKDTKVLSIGIGWLFLILIFCILALSH